LSNRFTLRRSSAITEFDTSFPNLLTPQRLETFAETESNNDLSNNPYTFKRSSAVTDYDTIFPNLLTLQKSETVAELDLPSENPFSPQRFMTNFHRPSSTENIVSIFSVKDINDKWKELNSNVFIDDDKSITFAPITQTLIGNHFKTKESLDDIITKIRECLRSESNIKYTRSFSCFSGIYLSSSGHYSFNIKIYKDKDNEEHHIEFHIYEGNKDLQFEFNLFLKLKSYFDHHTQSAKSRDTTDTICNSSLSGEELMSEVIRIRKLFDSTFYEHTLYALNSLSIAYKDSEMRQYLNEIDFKNILITFMDNTDMTTHKWHFLYAIMIMSHLASTSTFLENLNINLLKQIILKIKQEMIKSRSDYGSVYCSAYIQHIIPLIDLIDKVIV